MMEASYPEIYQAHSIKFMRCKVPKTLAETLTSRGGCRGDINMPTMTVEMKIVLISVPIRLAITANFFVKPWVEAVVLFKW